MRMYSKLQKANVVAAATKFVFFTGRETLCATPKGENFLKFILASLCAAFWFIRFLLWLFSRVLGRNIFRPVEHAIETECLSVATGRSCCLRSRNGSQLFNGSRLQRVITMFFEGKDFMKEWHANFNEAFFLLKPLQRIPSMLGTQPCQFSILFLKLLGIWQGFQFSIEQAIAPHRYGNLLRVICRSRERSGSDLLACVNYYLHIADGNSPKWRFAGIEGRKLLQCCRKNPQLVVANPGLWWYA